jgi:hypothetical protein
LGRFVAKKAPPQFNLARQQEFLAHLRNGMRRGAAAELLGFSRMTVMNYIGEHPEFESQVTDAEGQANEHVEEALFQAAVSGNVGACRAWMELRGGYLSARAGGVPHRAPEQPTAPPEPDEDELFGNVTRMDPRARRKKH